MQHILQYLTDLKIALDALDPAQIEAVRDHEAAVRERGGQLFLCGNSGSAATASHLGNDLGKGASYGRQGPRFRVIALTDNPFDYYGPFTQYVAFLVGASVATSREAPAPVREPRTTGSPLLVAGPPAPLA